MPSFDLNKQTPSQRDHPQAPAASVWKDPQTATQLACCAALYFVVLGAPALLLPALYPAILEQTGWTRSQVMGFASFKFAAGAVTALFIGFAIARLGARITCLVAALGVSLALGLCLLANNLNWYYLLALALGACTIAASISLKTLITETFAEHQGLALGIALLGAGLGAAIAPVVAQALLELLDWRTILCLFGLLGLLVVAAVQPVLMDSRASHAPNAALFSLQPLRSRLRNPTFHALAWVAFFSGFTDQTITQTTKAYLELDLHYSGMQASLVLSSIVLVSLGARLFFGWVFDRFRLTGVAACMLLAAVASACLLFPLSPLVLAIFVLCRGAAQGGRILQVPVMTRLVFGFDHLPHLIGILTAVYCLGMALGPAMAGVVYDLANSYLPAFVLCIFLQIGCVIILLNLASKLRSS